MDTAQLLLVSQARQGDPQAIAALMQYELRHQSIEVCGWKKGTTLHLELMGQAYPARSEVLIFISNGLHFLKADGIEAARVVVYVEGEEDPRWVERIGLKISKSKPSQALQRKVELNASTLQKALRPSLKLAAITASTCALLLTGFSLSFRAVQPSFAEQEQQRPMTRRPVTAPQ